MPGLADKYRPTTWSEVVAQEKTVARLKALAARGGLAGRAYFLTGQSGTGKSTIARLIAQEVADPFLIEEVDAAALTVRAAPIARRGDAAIRLGGEERPRLPHQRSATALRKPVIRQLLVLLERIPAHVVIVFTTTCEGQDALFEDYDDASPLLSRCLRLDLARRDLSRPFAERAKQIAMAEGIDGLPIERYVKLAQACKNNLRAMLQAIDAGDLLS